MFLVAAIAAVAMASTAIAETDENVMSDLIIHGSKDDKFVQTMEALYLRRDRLVASGMLLPQKHDGPAGISNADPEGQVCGFSTVSSVFAGFDMPFYLQKTTMDTADLLTVPGPTLDIPEYPDLPELPELPTIAGLTICNPLKLDGLPGLGGCRCGDGERPLLF